MKQSNETYVVELHGGQWTGPKFSVREPRVQKCFCSSQRSFQGVCIPYNKQLELKLFPSLDYIFKRDIHFQILFTESLKMLWE